MVQLAVPHVSQNNLQFLNQCGQACVVMLTRAFGLARPTVESAARRSGTWDKSTSSIREMLVGGAALPHFVVVTGIDERYVTLNDPLQSRGSYRTLVTRFDAAINATVPDYYSTPRLALYPVARRLPVAAPHDLAAFLVERVRAQAAQARELLR
jgi:hypothetical protein